MGGVLPCWMMPCSSKARHSSTPWRRLSTSPLWSSQSMRWQPGKERLYATPCSSLSCRMEFLSPTRLKPQQKHRWTASQSDANLSAPHPQMCPPPPSSWSTYCSYSRCPLMKIFTSVLKGNVPSSLRKRYSSLASLKTCLWSQTRKIQ